MFSALGPLSTLVSDRRLAFLPPGRPMIELAGEATSGDALSHVSVGVAESGLAFLPPV